MNRISSEKFWKGINKNKKIRYIVISVFAIITAIFGIIGFFESKRDLGTPKALPSVSETEEYAFIDVADKPYLFAESDTTKLYFVWDVNDKLYIVDLLAGLAEKLEKATLNNPIKISGKTKEVTSQIRVPAIRVYNRDKSDDMESLTYGNFDTIVGNFYLYAREDMTNAMVFYAIGAIFLLFALAFLIAHVYIENKIKRIINKLSIEEANLISLEVERENATIFEKVSVFITENYIISMGNSLDITKLNDIVWVYFTDIRQNGVLSNRRVDIFTHDHKNHWIPIVPYGKSRNTHLDIIEEISRRNPNALIGFTDENQRIMKEDKKRYKKSKND